MTANFAGIGDFLNWLLIPPRPDAPERSGTAVAG
jgi:hypothetical protein